MVEILRKKNKRIFYDYAENIAVIVTDKGKWVYLNPTIVDMENICL